MGSRHYPFADIDERTKRFVWERGEAVDGMDPNVFRKDSQGHLIRFDHHGERTPYGWEIGPIVHRNWGNQAAWYLERVQPVWWARNRAKQTD